MGLETGTYIEDLRADWPISTDTVSEGDDHLNLIKKVLKNQFPSLGAASVDVSAPTLNYSAGLTGNIQDQLDALGALEGVIEISSGMNMFFYNVWDSAFGEQWRMAPASEIPNNYMLVVDQDNPGGVGGDVDPTNYGHYHTTAGYALTSSQIPHSTQNIATGPYSWAMLDSNVPQQHNHGDTGTSTTSLRHARTLVLTKL